MCAYVTVVFLVHIEANKPTCLKIKNCGGLTSKIILNSDLLICVDKNGSIGPELTLPNATIGVNVILRRYWHRQE